VSWGSGVVKSVRPRNKTTAVAPVLKGQGGRSTQAKTGPWSFLVCEGQSLAQLAVTYVTHIAWAGSTSLARTLTSASCIGAGALHFRPGWFRRIGGFISTAPPGPQVAEPRCLRQCVPRPKQTRKRTCLLRIELRNRLRVPRFDQDRGHCISRHVFS